MHISEVLPLQVLGVLDRRGCEVGEGVLKMFEVCRTCGGLRAKRFASYQFINEKRPAQDVASAVVTLRNACVLMDDVPVTHADHMRF